MRQGNIGRLSIPLLSLRVKRIALALAPIHIKPKPSSSPSAHFSCRFLSRMMRDPSHLTSCARPSLLRRQLASMRSIEQKNFEGESIPSSESVLARLGNLKRPRLINQGWCAVPRVAYADEEYRGATTTSVRGSRILPTVGTTRLSLRCNCDEHMLNQSGLATLVIDTIK